MELKWRNSDGSNDRSRSKFINIFRYYCLIFLGIDERYIIIDNYNKSVGFGNVLHCKRIYNAINSKNTNRMTPREVLKIFEEKGWLDE